MRRGAHALAYVALFAFAGCGKDIADAPMFTGGQDEGGSAAGTGTGSNTTDGGDDDDDGAMDQGQDSGPGDEAPMDTMPPSDSSSDGAPDPTTGPVGDSGDGMMGGCNDGMVSPGEQCDGADLQGFDCSSLGLAGGTLSCDPVTCTFDTSMCMSGNGSGTGGM